jgi:hypothetical protein
MGSSRSVAPPLAKDYAGKRAYTCQRGTQVQTTQPFVPAPIADPPCNIRQEQIDELLEKLRKELFEQAVMINHPSIIMRSLRCDGLDQTPDPPFVNVMTYELALQLV